MKLVMHRWGIHSTTIQPEYIHRNMVRACAHDDVGRYVRRNVICVALDERRYVPRTCLRSTGLSGTIDLMFV